MEDWTRVLLYGTFDWFAYSTDDFPRTVVVLDSGERVEVPEECVVSADRMINKNKIKLKDVIARIKELDLGTQKVWLNEILNELGSDYGTLKYKDGYEQGKLEGEWVGRQLKDAEKIRQELNKPTVPQIVADYIKYAKDSDWDFQDLFKCIEDEEDEKLTRWVYHERNQETLADAWINGYTVEEKRYLVKMKGISVDSDYLNYDSIDDEWYLASDINGCNVRTHHTRKELEEAGFGWVLDCPGIEIEEVKE